MQLIELNGDENITVIRNLLASATEREVLLYVPKGCEALEKNRVNLTLLRRHADSLNLRLGVVIEDRETRGLAKDVDLLVLRSIRQAQRANLEAWDRRRRRRDILPPRPTAPLVTPLPARPSTRRRRGANVRQVLVGLLAFGLVVLALALTVLLVLPSATVTLQPVSEPMEMTMEIVGTAGIQSIRYETGEVPARVVSVVREGTDKIATTGRIDVPDGHAQGTVVFANRTTIPVTITKGTVVRTSTGDNVRFYTVADAWLPGELYATVRVGVLAAEPGPKGNVPALTINVIEGELAAQADVLNDQRLTGGTVRRMGAVQGEDRVRVRARLMKRLQEEAYAELTAALAQKEFIPPDSLVIAVVAEEFDHKVGDMADELGLTMRVRVTGLAINAADGEELLLRLLEQRMKPGYQLVQGSPVFRNEGLREASPEQARFAMSVRASVAPTIDTQRVSETIAGRTVKEAEEYLSRGFALRSEPRIKLENSPWQRLPWWARRIRVRVVTE